MFRLLLRQSQYCPGAEQCEAAETAKCNQCGEEWHCDDVYRRGACSECGSDESFVIRCEQCPMNRLYQIKATCDAGPLIDRMIDLELYVKEMGLRWDELTAEEMKVYHIVIEERHKLREEEKDEAESDRQIKAAMKTKQFKS